MSTLTEFLTMLLPEVLRSSQLAVTGLCNTYVRLTSSKYLELIEKNTSRYSLGRELRQDLDECAICVSEYVGGEEVREMNNCKHAFHVDCIDKWLVIHDPPTCPLCRCLVLPEKVAVGRQFQEVEREHGYENVELEEEQMINAIAFALIGSEN